MNISIFGGGEVGGCYAHALARAGHRIHVICDIDHRASVTTLADAVDASLETQAGPWLAQSDVVINAVYGHAALGVARAALPPPRPDAVFADFTTASPEDMQSGAALARPRDMAFVDVAIMGAIFMQGDKTPLLCAGVGAERVAEIMRAAGAPARAIEGKAGDSVGLKLLRSILTKGLESLAVECLVAAESKQLRPALYEVLRDLDDTPFTTLMESFVRSHVVHAERRLAEVREAREQISADGLEPKVLNGVESLFERSAAALAERRAHPEQYDAPIGESLDARIAWLSTLARKT